MSTATGHVGWGAGSSATVLDGVAPASALARWARDGRHLPSAAGGPPGSPGDSSPAGGSPGVDAPGVGFTARHRELLGALAASGLRTLRLPLEWARLEPSDGRRDREAEQALREVLAAARELGVDVWGCLVDDTLPGWFAHDERGFADARARRYHWARHVESVGEAFGDLVAGWVPVHEPNRWARRGWLTGRRPPGRAEDTRGFAAALEGIQLAAVDAARRLRGGGRPVATSQWVVPLFPARPDPDSPPPAEAEAMRDAADEALFGSWRRLLHEETLIVGHRPPVAVPGAREAFDLVGFSYRHGAAVRGDGALLPYPQDLEPGPDGRVPWSHGLALALHRVAETFPDRPLLVTGVGLVTDREDRREGYVRDVVEIVGEARDGGVDLRGLWWEHPFDPPGSGPATAGLVAADGTPRPALGPLRDAAGPG